MISNKITFFLCFTILLSGCTTLKYRELKKIGFFEDGKFSETIPFDYVNNLMVIQVDIDSQPFNFIFDTGAEAGVVSSDILPKINYKDKSKLKVHGAEGEANRLTSITIDNIKIGNIKFADMWVLSTDISYISNLFACKMPIHGIIGNNMMRKANWKIDHQNQIIKFQNLNQKFSPLENSLTISMKCGKYGNAYIPVEIGGKKIPCTFDTGSNGFISISDKSVKSIDNIGSSIESESLLGSIHGQKFVKQESRLIESSKIGEVLLKNKVFSISYNSKELVGNKLWKNYNFIIDWHNCKLHLEPIREIKPDSLRVFQYGIAHDFDKNKLFISKRWKSHSLYQSIEGNNEIVSIDTFMINDKMDLCDFMDDNYPELKKKDELKLTILEEENRREIVLKKETLITNSN